MEEFNTPEKRMGAPDERDKKLGVVDAMATGLSWILVPLLMPLYGSILAFGLSVLRFVPTATLTVLAIIIFCITAVAPMLIVFVLKVFGVVDDIGLNNRKERLIPYIVTAVSLGCTAWFVATRNAPMWFTMFFAGGAAGALVNLLINFRWKISAHAAGMAGIVAMLLRLIHAGAGDTRAFTWLIVWIVLTGLLGASRVWLGRHTPMQVVCGYIVGFTTVWVATGLSI